MQYRSHWAKTKVFLLEAPLKKRHPCLFWYLEVAPVPWVMSTFLYLQGQLNGYFLILLPASHFLVSPQPREVVHF